MATTLIFPRPGTGRTALLSTWLVWLAVGVSVAYWGLLLWGQAPRVEVAVTPRSPALVDSAIVARALGAVKPQQGGPEAPASMPKVVLLGVVGGSQGKGVALLSVDGQAAKPYPVGAEVVGGWRLAEVAGRTAVLALGRDKAAPVHRLALPPLK
jgi:general secretion pathway protein C